MNDRIKVKKLLKPEVRHIAVMVNWMYCWWGIAEGYSAEEVECYMTHSLNDAGFPQTYGVFIDDELIGMYQFTLSDLDIRPDIYPWLANVYLQESYRGNGYISTIMDSVKTNAIRNGLNELYLYTWHTGLYEKYGFTLIEEFDTFKKHPRVQKLYRLKLSKPTHR